MNTAKILSNIDGMKYLRDALDAEQNVLACQLELSQKSVTHDGKMGEVNEQHFISFLSRYLPKRYRANSGIVIDSNGRTSDQIDIIIYDRQYTPTLLDQQSHRFIPAEAVYCVLEVKPKIDKQYIAYAGEKAKSVRVLKRTSVSIPHAGGVYKPKKPFSIIAGIIAIDSGWVNGIECNALQDGLKALSVESSLQCGLALKDRSFFSSEDTIIYGPKKCSLAFFLFRLLNELQLLGTVPAIDWSEYSNIFCDDESNTH